MTFYGEATIGSATISSPQTITLVDSTGTEFLRTIDAGVVTDTALDGVTAFAPVGAVSSPTINASSAELLVDNNGVEFWRFSDGTNSFDRDIDGTTPFAPTLPVSPASGTTAGAQQNASDIDIGNAVGTILAGATSLSVLNKSAVDILWNGEVLSPGEGQSYQAATGNTLDAFPYDTTASGAVGNVQVTEVR